jgi:hypothetical protein
LSCLCFVVMSLTLGYFKRRTGDVGARAGTNGRLHLDSDRSCGRLRDFTFDEFKRASRTRHLNRSHDRHYTLSDLPPVPQPVPGQIKVATSIMA